MDAENMSISSEEEGEVKGDSEEDEEEEEEEEMEGEEEEEEEEEEIMEEEDPAVVNLEAQGIITPPSSTSPDDQDLAEDQLGLHLVHLENPVMNEIFDQDPLYDPYAVELDKSYLSSRDTSCDFCYGLELGSNYLYKIHRTTDCKRLQCKYCLLEFSIKSELSLHLELHKHDGNPNKYSCPECSDANFKESIQLQDHLSYDHTGIFEFECSLCAFRCNQETDYTKHKTKH